MKNLSARWIFALSVLVLCVMVAASYIHKKQVQQEKLSYINREVANTLKHDGLPEDEWQHLKEISDAVQAGHPITDSQLTFLLSALHKTHHGQTSQVSRMVAVVTLESIKNLAPSQKQSVRQVLTPQLAMVGTPHDRGVTDTQISKIMACNILAKQGIREAVPDILPLLDDPNPQTRQVAEKSLRKLGYNPS